MFWRSFRNINVSKFVVGIARQYDVLPCFRPQIYVQKGYFSTEPKTDFTFDPRKCVLLKKFTRYEYEKKLKPDLSEECLKTYLIQKGSDYKGLVERHSEYMIELEKVRNHLVKKGIEVQLADRYNYHADLIKWADMIVTVGGDGTFLMAASKVTSQSKPVIGINADPKRSEGYLCLPLNCSSKNVDAIDRIINGKFKWMWRQRIRLTMSGKYTHEDPVNLHNQQLFCPEHSEGKALEAHTGQYCFFIVGREPEPKRHRFQEDVKEHETYCSKNVVQFNRNTEVLPILALNEVFIGESLSARVSFYEISVDGSIRVKQKSSGLTVCTGTGSTSWFFNINNIPKQSVRDILRIATEKTKGCNFDLQNELLIRQITKEFNSSLTYDPEVKQLAYVVRDPVVNGVFSVNNPRGFCRKMSVKSRMWDAWVVVDGEQSYRFNDGAVVDLEINENDALRCVRLDK